MNTCITCTTCNACNTRPVLERIASMIANDADRDRVDDHLSIPFDSIVQVDCQFRSESLLRLIAKQGYRSGRRAFRTLIRHIYGHGHDGDPMGREGVARKMHRRW